MKLLSKIFLGLVLFSQFSWADNQEIRARIGSTFSAPTSYNGKFYFVATTGVLFEANKDLSKVSQLFDGKKQTIGAATLVGDKLFWGDGLHTDKKSTLHVFDLKTKKHLKDITLEGHIERAPLISDDLILIPAGPGGLVALDLNTFKEKWKITQHEGKKFHVDSNILKVGSKACATSIYEFKGIFCVDINTGKVSQLSQLSRNPKSEITLWNENIVGFATEGDLSKAKWDVPADLYIYDVKADKIKMSKELRGFNFFAPQIQNDEAFVTLSTGDFILIRLNDGKIQFLGEFSEPFTNNPFMKGSEYCAIGIMGKYMCYGKTKSGHALTVDKRIMEMIIGKITYEGKKLIAPSRTGYYVE